MRRIEALLLLLLVATSAQAFRFSEEDAKARAEADAGKVAAIEISPACRKRLGGERVLLLIAERGNSGINAEQSRYSLHFNGIEKRLRGHGMRTYSQAEIKKQIAQAEIDAHFRNDPDAALAAAKKLGATLILRGMIGSQHGINPVLKINEVAVNMGFALQAGGKSLADVNARADSYSGTDTVGMALKLIDEQADDVVNRLVSGYCEGRGEKKK
ncbi:MAG: hypothetical protein Q8O25_03875 [Sulfurisoma sp.]|nr:hypothetical protein [Sulfurisoma sp.]